MSSGKTFARKVAVSPTGKATGLTICPPAVRSVQIASASIATVVTVLVADGYDAKGKHAVTV